MTSKYENEAIRKVQKAKCDVNGCQMEETGVCALHDVEVERRESMKALVNKIPGIMTRLNLILGTTGSIGMIIAASFLYTSMVKTELRQEITLQRQEGSVSVSKIRSLVHDIAVTQGKNIQAQKFQLKQLSRLNTSISNMLERQETFEDLINKRIDARFDSWGTQRNQ